MLQETEFASNGVPTKKVIYAIGHDQINQTTATYSGGVWGSGVTAYFGTDGHGSVRVLVDALAAIVNVGGLQLYHYDAYGNLLNCGSGTAQPLTSYLYSGESFDFALGQQYLRARWYDATTGRFNRLDPFAGNSQDPQSFHKYAYVHNNPVNSIDPTGLFSLGGMLGGMAIGGGIGGLSGAALGAAYAGFTGKMTMWQGMWQGSIIGAMLGSFIGGGIGVGAVSAGGMIRPALFNILRGFPAASYAIFIAMSESRQNGAFLRNQERELDDHLSYVQGRIFGGNSRSRDLVAKLAPKINSNAAGVAPELLASVMLGELYHMNILDTLFDDPNNPNRSVGYAQINARTIVGHNHPELAGKSANEIGNSLLDG